MSSTLKLMLANCVCGSPGNSGVRKISVMTPKKKQGTKCVKAICKNVAFLYFIVWIICTEPRPVQRKAD